ncbi:MAG: Calx-beta domain-containing protein, partial [Bdellovibrionota bacterium]
MRKLLKILSLIILSACIGTPSDEQSSIAKFKKIEIQFEEISLSEGENKLFNIELSQNTVEDLVLEWKILGPNVNSRFQFTEGTVSIQKNTKSVPVQLKSLDDGVFNPNLEYEIVLENLSEVRQQIETSGRSFVLIDNDPKPEISFSSTSNDGLEHIGSVPVYISLDKASAKTLQVRYTVKDSSTASASDYVISGSFEVPAFSTSSFFNFSIVDDVILEAPETVLLEIEEVLYDDIQLFISPTDNV